MVASRSKSRKRSAASSTSTRREPLTFFTDECLGSKHVPSALRAAGADVRIHTEHFKQGTPDVDWLRAISRHGWVVLTKDKNMRRRPLVVAALMEAGLRVFAVTAGDLTGEELGRLIVGALPKITRLCRRRGPFIARITRAGDVAIVRWRRRAHSELLNPEREPGTLSLER